MRGGFLRQGILLLALVLSIIGAVGSWRYWRVPSELRFAELEAWWQAGPYVVVLLVILGLLFERKQSPPSGE